jgi:hypothetical protein
VVGELFKVSGLRCTWLDLTILGARESVLQVKNTAASFVIVSAWRGAVKKLTGPILSLRIFAISHWSKSSFKRMINSSQSALGTFAARPSKPRIGMLLPSRTL